MKKYLIIIALFSIIFGFTFYILKPNKNPGIDELAPVTSPQEISDIPSVENNPPEKPLDIPLAKAKERITKKYFSIFVTPQNSPVKPERFQGFHTGTDFEILGGEENKDVRVSSICDGKVIYKDRVNGYGGVIIQSCEINSQSVTVLYGHISLVKSPAKVGEQIKQSDMIAVLGSGMSYETDGERKHLHLGIRKGTQIDFRGYVKSENELDGWMDFEKIFGVK